MGFIEIEFRRQDRDWNMTKLQAHDYYEIYCLLEGERRFFLEDRLFTLKENCFVVVPPFSMHKTEGGRYRRINFYVSPDLLDGAENSFLKDCSRLGAFRLSEEKNAPLFEVLNQLVKREDLSGLHKKYALPLLRSLLYFLQTGEGEAEGVQCVSATEEASQKNQADGLVLQVVSYLNEHYREKITLDFLAKKFFISKNSLGGRFFKIMQCSVMDYCLTVRLNAAKHLLLSTDKSVTEVGEACGFLSANYFCLIFKRKVGISPLNYRKKN